jgi:hypothetical protein
VISKDMIIQFMEKHLMNIFSPFKYKPPQLAIWARKWKKFFSRKRTKNFEQPSICEMKINCTICFRFAESANGRKNWGESEMNKRKSTLMNESHEGIKR